METVNLFAGTYGRFFGGRPNGFRHTVMRIQLGFTWERKPTDDMHFHAERGNEKNYSVPSEGI